MNKLEISDSVSAAITRKREEVDYFDPKGVFTIEHWRDGVLLNKFDIKNTIVNEGKNHALGVVFNGVTPVTTWYMGLIDNTSFSTVAATDTMSSHSGWIENTAYTQSTRPEWDAGAPSSQTITNASPVVFDINATGTLRGVFIGTNNTKAGTTGTLWSGVLFSATVAVANGDQIKNTYTITT